MLSRPLTQQRSERTIEKIFEATHQLIDMGGDTALSTLSTNKIAAKAGVAVGTVYQYFSTKEAIFEAMVDRDRSLLLRQLNRVLDKTEQPNEAPADLLAEFIHVLVQTLASSHKLQQHLVRLGWLMDQKIELTEAILNMTNAIGAAVNRIAAQSHQSSDAVGWRLKPVKVFMVSRALIGVLRSASLERSHLLGSPELEAELLLLARLLTTDN